MKDQMQDEQRTNAVQQAPLLSPLDERLCFALYSSAQAITKKYKKSLATLNLTYPQYITYLALEPHQSLTVKALGELLFLDSGTLTPLLKRMEQQGLVTRQRDTNDERKVYVKLTQQARDLSGSIAKIQEEVACSTQLDPVAFEQLRNQLQSLNRLLRD